MAHERTREEERERGSIEEEDNEYEHHIISTKIKLIVFVDIHCQHLEINAHFYRYYITCSSRILNIADIYISLVIIFAVIVSSWFQTINCKCKKLRWKFMVRILHNQTFVFVQRTVQIFHFLVSSSLGKKEERRNWEFVWGILTIIVI